MDGRPVIQRQAQQQHVLTIRSDKPPPPPIISDLQKSVIIDQNNQTQFTSASFRSIYEAYNHVHTHKT